MRRFGLTTRYLRELVVGGVGVKEGERGGRERYRQREGERGRRRRREGGSEE